MTDPTRQAATAKTAREIVKAHLEALDEWSAKGWDDMSLERMASPYEKLFTDEVVRVARSALALRALLDAPEGGVGRVIEAAESMVSAEEQYCVGTETTLEGAVLVHAGNAKRVYQAAIALRAALAALRASPESVGGAGVSLADDLRKARDAARIKHLSEALQHEAKCAEEASAEVQRLKADLAAARGEVERLRTEIAGDSHTCANGTVRPYPSVVCSLCVSRGITPPPATEAPISERIGPYAVDEVRVHPDGVFMVTLVGELEAVRSAGARLFEQVWLVADSAAAERAVKAPQAEG